MNEWTLPALALVTVIFSLTALPIIVSIVKGWQRKKALRSELGHHAPEDMIGARTLREKKKHRYRAISMAVFLCVVYLLGVLDNRNKWSQGEFLFITSFFVVFVAALLILATHKGWIVVTSIGVYSRSPVVGDRWIRWADVRRIIYDIERGGFVLYGQEDVPTEDDPDELLGIAVPTRLDGVEHFVRIALKMVPEDRWEGQSMSQAKSVIGVRGL